MSIAKPVLAFVGPLGSGKTTLARNTLRSGILPGRWSYLINDSAPSSDMVDGALGDLAEVAALAGGCFTCENPAELQRRLREALDAPAISGVIIEGYGSVSGMETVSALRQTGVPFQVVATLDVRNFTRNLHLLGGIVATQVAAATIGIGLTKAGCDDIADPSLAEVREFLEQHGRGVPVFLLPQGGSLPQWAARKVLAGSRRLVTAHEHHVGCGHDHGEHGHAHHHDHGGQVEQSVRLRPQTTLLQVEAAVRALAARGVFRAKGAAGGWQFHLVHDDFTVTEPDSRSFLAWFTPDPVEPNGLQEFAGIIEVPEEDRRRTQDLLRSDANADTASTIALIEELMAAIPTEAVVNAAGNLVTHPEGLQDLKEIARRPSVVQTHFGLAIRRCVQYWLVAAALLREQEARWEPRDLAGNKRELGISLTWWATKNAADLGSDLCAAVAGLYPADLAAEGMLALDLPFTDPDKGWWQAEEFRIAMEYAQAHGGNHALLAKAAWHACNLYRKRCGDNNKATEHWFMVACTSSPGRMDLSGSDSNVSCHNT